jgi:uncharacterized protein YbjT (DUF2867 family)
MLHILITGATGMVGEGVLLECLRDPRVTTVTHLGRRACGHRHEKLREVLVPDLSQLKAVRDQLTGIDACFFCAGISSVGMKEAEYTHITYNITLAVAHTLLGLNPNLVFTYVSGGGTDSSEKGRIMWARVKGRTENDLSKLPFRGVYLFRPGILKPVPGQLHVLKLYKYGGWLFPFMRSVFPGTAGTLQELAQAMLLCATIGSEKKILDVRSIRELADM